MNSDPQIHLDSKESIEKIFKDYYNPLCNYINKYINNFDDSQEVVQNTFMKLWEKKDKLVINTSIKSYLYKSAKNAMIDYIRKQKSTSEISEEETNIPIIEQDRPRDFDSYIIRNEILKAMEKLKPKNKLIFELHKFEGLTYKEIAEHLGISKRAVEDNIARAITILREELEDNPQIFH